VRACRVDGFWEEAGRPAELLKANRLYLDRLEPGRHRHEAGGTTVEGRVSLSAGSRAVNCHLRGPCSIQENCMLENSLIGPYVSLGPGCSIRDSWVEDCIIQQDCRVEHLRAGLSDSVLGTAVEVVGADSGSTGPLSLLLGDMSHMRAV
jgi:glucose-1-phosphate thymidylyltransferase